MSPETIKQISKEAVVCNSPYIRVGLECCLDQNGNGICDRDEKGSTATAPALAATPLPTTATQPATPLASPAPTPTPTSASSPVVAPQPQTLSGRGQQATSKFQLESGLSVFRMKHIGASNFAIWLYDSAGNRVALLANDIGSFDGTKAVGIKTPGPYLLDITADGDWTVTIEQPRPTSAPAVPQRFTGKGQQVSPSFTLSSGLATFQMAHDGDSNFAIWLLDSTGGRVALLANDIGKFDGSKAAGIKRPGIYFLDIAADGNWAVSVSQ